MKSRYKKELTNLLKNRGKVLFTTTERFSKGDVLSADELIDCEIVELVDYEEFPNKANNKVLDMWVDLCMGIDNKLLTSKAKSVAIIKPVDGKFLVVTAENISDWIEAYWIEEDPNKERDWAYIDEDINDLYYHILKEYCLTFDKKYQKRLLRLI